MEEFAIQLTEFFLLPGALLLHKPLWGALAIVAMWIIAAMFSRDA